MVFINDAKNGEDALERVKEKPDLIVLDGYAQNGQFRIYRMNTRRWY